MTIQVADNRDEDTFEDGENYNGLHEPNPHRAFGNGRIIAQARTCRGAPSAILLPMLLERFPDMTLPGPASVADTIRIPRPLNMPILLQ